MIEVFLLLFAQTDHELLREVIRTTAPLEAPRGDRLPLYIWPAQSLGTTSEAEIEALLRDLDARGMAALGNWKPGEIVRSTDFGPETEPVLLRVDDAEVLVPRAGGRCQILELANGGVP